MSQSQKRIATTLATSAVCAVAGYQLSLQAGEDADSEKSAYMSAAVCGAGATIVSEYVHPEPSEQRLRNLESKNRQYESLMIRRGISLSSPQSDLLGRSGRKRSPSDFSGALSDLIQEDCHTEEYSLWYDQDRSIRSEFIPVNGRMIIQSFKYYLVVPKDGSNRDCVRPHSAFGYLEREILNLGDILDRKAMWIERGF